MVQLCPVCQQERHSKPGEKYNHYTVVYCEQCSLQYSDPMRDPGAEFYSRCGLYDGRADRGNLALPELDWRYRTALSLIPNRAGTRILDVGCGDGGFLSMVASRGLTAYGIDHDAKAIKFAREERGLTNLHIGAWTELEQLSGWSDFEVITLFDVLEHVADPSRLVRLLHSLLAPNGTLCITVPRLDRFPRMFDAEADIPPHHLTLWTSPALRSLLSRIGYANIRIVEKPLMAEDLQYIMLWKIKRLLRGQREYSNGSGPSQGRSDGNSRTYSKRVFRSMLKLVSIPPVIGLRMSGMARGCTLMVLAQKE